MERYLYLALDLFAISIPLWRSFDKRFRFADHWNAFFPAMAITAAFFIAWDVWFTDMGIWGFNPKYLTGIYLFNLPLEEWLFFICIPYACVFTYEALGYFIKKPPSVKVGKIIALGLVLLLGTIAAINYTKWYTGLTFALLSTFLIALVFFTRINYLGRFFLSYAVILIPFFMVNGLLTGAFIPEEVVWYNDNENLGLRMGTIPVEDTFYGMLLILMNVVGYEYLKQRKS